LAIGEMIEERLDTETGALHVQMRVPYLRNPTPLVRGALYSLTFLFTLLFFFKNQFNFYSRYRHLNFSHSFSLNLGFSSSKHVVLFRIFTNVEYLPKPALLSQKFGIEIKLHSCSFIYFPIIC